jgi:hypothetical protein
MNAHKNISFESSFNIESYKLLIDMLLQTHSSLRFCDAPNRDPAGSYFLSRHDVDYSLEHALEMAKVDHDLGVKSTFFILVTSPLYNLRLGCHLREIALLGHEIGLHYDIAEMEKCSYGRPLLEVLDAQAEFLGFMAGEPIRAIAAHNPSVTGRTSIPGQSKYIDAYDPEYFSQEVYASDACVAWRDSGLSLLRSNPKPRLIQIGTHPYCWFAPGETRSQKLGSVFGYYQSALNEAQSEFLSSWRMHRGVLEHDARQARKAAKE